MKKQEKINKKEVANKTELTTRELLNKILYKTEKQGLNKEQQQKISSPKLKTIDEILEGYETSKLKRLEDEIKKYQISLARDIKKLDFDLKEMASRTSQLSKNDQKEILSEFASRRRHGTIDKNKTMELTVVLEKKVRAIRDSRNKARKILKSSTIGIKNKEANIEQEKQRLNTNSIKYLLKNKMLMWTLIVLVSLLVITLIALIVVFVV